MTTPEGAFGQPARGEGLVRSRPVSEDGDKDATTTDSENEGAVDPWDAVHQLARAAREARDRGDIEVATALEAEWLRRRAELLQSQR